MSKDPALAPFISVLLDQNLSKPLDYSVPEKMQRIIAIGQRVVVPLRKGLVKGTVTAIKFKPDHPSVKPISTIIHHQSALSPTLWKLANWMSEYYCTPLQRVIKCFTPPNIRKDIQPKKKMLINLATTHDVAIDLCAKLRTTAPVQAKVLDALLQETKGIYTTDLPGARSAIDALFKKNILKKTLVEAEPALDEEDFFPTLPKKLTAEQHDCLEKVKETLLQNKYAAHLIHGITGSGKTEVYLQAIAAALEQGKSAILLVPEIALTSQTIERFRARFSEKLAILHHRRSHGERTSAWQALQKNEAKIVIGARSAIFAPAQNLGLIIVDEEHDSSYKQSEELPTYQARDVAVMRGHLENAAVLLGSATPSIESYSNAKSGKYILSTLKNRATEAKLAKVHIVDLKTAMDRTGGFTHFSPELLTAIKDRVEKGEQTLLFLNKRGYHRSQICASCREIVKCPHCDLSLTFHKHSHLLCCHLCDYQRDVPRTCPSCNSPEAFEFKGFGTEHVERSLHAIFPTIRTLRMDRDTTRGKTSHEDLFKQFRAHKADVLIGTQMIAKGFHFPSVTLVGVLNSDATLQIPDFRSSEKLFQLLTQVAGRAGRSELAGEVFIQTFMPDHPIFKLAKEQDFESFYQSEIEERRTFAYPPFCHLIKLLFSGKEAETAQKAAEDYRFRLQALKLSYLEILPVSPAGHPKVKDLYRYQFLCKTLKVKDLSKRLAQFAPPHKISVLIDIDPLSTFF